MPQPGQGKPVNILNGQYDCSFSKCLPVLLSIIKYGIASVIKAPTIPYILYLVLILLVKFINITLNNHSSNHRKKKT